MMTVMESPIHAEQLMIVPANQAPWDDLAAIFGTTDYPGRCQCQRFKVPGWIWRDSTQEERTAMLRAQTACGDPGATATSGLVAYLDDEPVGAGSRSSPGRHTPSCAPLASRGAAATRTRATTASGQ
jgi:hypothetical protein